MHFKLIIVMVEDNLTPELLDAAREAGATGATVLNQARGEGISPARTFLGLSMDHRVDVIMLLAEEHMARDILEHVSSVGEFDDRSGTGIAIQIDVEDAIGVSHQIKALEEAVEERI